jgi:LytS/YehU family sensor histidine kinase
VQVQRSNHGNKMAINNIRHRIQQLYGDSAELTQEDLQDKYRLTLRYQLQRSKKQAGT